MFEATGVFTIACDTWRVKAAAEKTYANFTAHFTEENRERLRKLTAAQAGYHGANAITPGSPPPEVRTDARAPDVAAAAQQPPATPVPHVVTNDGVRMYYCWTHGLGTNATHTSSTCQRPASGHQIDATVTNMQGGNNTIMGGGPRRRLPADS
jgi:hypothetical protein